MTREEAIKHLRNDWFMSLGGQLCVDEDKKDAFLEAVGMGIKALRPVSRELGEKVWRGKWKIIEYEFFTCSRCGDSYYNGAESHEQAESYLNSGYVYDFCPHCGSANTDKAVEMVMERLEALKDGSTPD